MATRLESLREPYKNWETMPSNHSGKGTEVYLHPDGTLVARIGTDTSHAEFVRIVQANVDCTGFPKIISQCVYEEEPFNEPWMSVTEIERPYRIEDEISESLEAWLMDAVKVVGQGGTPTTDPYGLAESVKIVVKSVARLPRGHSCGFDAQAKNVMIRNFEGGRQYVWMDALD